MVNKVILNRKPKEYLKQGLFYCGGYVIKGILSAFGKDDGRKPRQYVPFHSVASSNFIIRELEKYGLKARVKSAKGFSQIERLEILKEHLRLGYPVILRIGNGYDGNRDFSLIKALVMGHWISLWGFNDNKSLFYVKMLEQKTSAFKPRMNAS